MTRDQIRELRQQLGWTQERLAGELGVSWTTISRWENGKAKPTSVGNRRELQRLVEQVKGREQ